MPIQKSGLENLILKYDFIFEINDDAIGLLSNMGTGRNSAKNREIAKVLLVILVKSVISATGIPNIIVNQPL